MHRHRHMYKHLHPHKRSFHEAAPTPCNRLLDICPTKQNTLLQFGGCRVLYLFLTITSTLIPFLTHFTKHNEHARDVHHSDTCTRSHTHCLSLSLFDKHIHTLEYKSNISICTGTDLKSGRAYFLPVLVGLEGTDLASLVVIVQEGETAVTHEAGTLGSQLTVVNHPSDETTTIKS